MWSHFQNILLILTPLFIGFACKLPKPYVQMSDRLLSVLVYVILLLIGVELAQVDNLGQELGKMAMYAALLFILLMMCNLLILFWFDKLFFKQHPFQPSQTTRQKIRFADSAKQMGVLIFGMILGVGLPENWLPPHQSGQYALMTLILIVGIQMRGNGIALRQILLNKHGLYLSAWFMASCGLAGLLFAAILPEVGWAKGLALSSGYGWYSLSGIVMTQAYGATWGGVALLNDLWREFAALMFIPLLMQRFPSSAIGLGGATSLDFTLPIIQKSGGLAAVPVAVSFGFIVNLVAPFLMVLFSAIG